MGIMPGRRVIALRWEGVAEGIRHIPNETIQTFKSQRSGSSGGFVSAAGQTNLTI